MWQQLEQTWSCAPSTSPASLTASTCTLSGSTWPPHLKRTQFKISSIPRNKEQSRARRLSQCCATSIQLMSTILSFPWTQTLILPGRSMKTEPNLTLSITSTAKVWGSTSPHQALKPVSSTQLRQLVLNYERFCWRFVKNYSLLKFYSKTRESKLILR